MDASGPGWPSSPQRGDGEGRLENQSCLFSRVQFKYLVGVVLSISEEGGHCLVGFLRGRIWTEGAWDGTFHPNIPDFLDIWMPGAKVTLPTKHPRLFGYMDVRG